MFDETAECAASVAAAGELDGVMVLLAGLGTEVGDEDLIERISALEQVKAAAGAAQARMTAAFVASQRAAQVTAGVPARRVGQGTAAQVALAKRESPARAARYTGWATILVTELPNTFATLACGLTTEWRAMIVARETIWLSRADRATVDRELAHRLPTLGDNHVDTETRKIAYRLDPNRYLKRSATAASGRRVTLRPAPDTMARLTTLVPAAQGVAAYTALLRAADTARATGDPRSRGQVMADTLIERVTGQLAADDVPVHVNVVITDYTLFGNSGADTSAGDAGATNPDATQHGARNPDVGADEAAPGGGDDGDINTETDSKSDEHDQSSNEAASYEHTETDGTGDRDDQNGEADAGFNEPAHLVGYGPIPAGLARGLIRAHNAPAWLRRLYRDPDTHTLVAMDSRARTFPPGIRHALIIRDQVCRTPWCAAPIRHTDHARSHTLGGDTSLDNGQSLCEACNYAKQAPGWHTTPAPNGTSHSVTTTTPTGHTYISRPPDLPGARSAASSGAGRQGAAPSGAGLGGAALPRRAPIADEQAA